MLSNINQQTMETSILYYNSHATKNTNTSSNNNKNNNKGNDNIKEFSIYRPDVDFSINYEPIGHALNENTRLVIDAKDSVEINTSNVITRELVDGSGSSAKAVSENVLQNGNINGRAVMMSYGNEYPTNLHNYSKVPDMINVDRFSDKNNNKNNSDNASHHNSNDSNSRDEILASSDVEDENTESRNRDDNNNPSNKIEDRKPEHHVRRPMNAFLIFCKRHRALVREKYPNLENRSITKILGDWWAYLPNEDKLPYKDLAKNYKDVFFTKNPNFKWYKLPAPPLRTLSTRPSNDQGTTTGGLTASSALNSEEVHDESPKDRLVRNMKASQGSSGIGQFKLASIDQMGGLSSLMIESLTPRLNGVNYLDTQNKNEDSQKNKKRKGDDVMDICDDEISGKSRACKGKRYEQFMTPTKKAIKQKNASSLLSKNASAYFPHNGYCKPQEVSMNTKQTNELIDSSDEMIHSSDETSEAKNADANDFKLNDKIMTLPSLDLEDYLNRKKAMKKKKKFTHKSKNRQQQNAQAVPKDRTIPKPHTAVGSQKRKAPKQTIRRTTDINEQEISRVGLIGLDTLATLALVQANANSPQ